MFVPFFARFPPHQMPEPPPPEQVLALEQRVVGVQMVVEVPKPERVIAAHSPLPELDLPPANVPVMYAVTAAAHHAAWFLQTI